MPMRRQWHKPPFPWREFQPIGQAQAGFTLVELMVSLALGLLVVTAMLGIYLNTSRTNVEMAKTNSQIESGRFAMQFLQNDLAHAGFWGTFVPAFDDLTSGAVPGDAPTGVPAPCLAYNSTNWNAAYKTNLIGIPLQVYDDVPAGCAAVVADRLAGTDVLVVRHLETCLPGVGNCEADTPGRLYFQSTLCESELATPYVLDTSGFGLRLRDCATIAPKRRFISNIYYVRDYLATAGDGIPTLVRSQFNLAGGSLAHQAPVPLVEGVEAMRVELGIDDVSETGAAVDYTAAVNWADPANRVIATNRGDGVPDGDFVRCTTAAPCTAAQLTNATALKLYLLVRSREATPGYTDDKTYTLASDGTQTDPCAGLSGAALAGCKRFKRHAFTTTVRLNNIAARRETP